MWSIVPLLTKRRFVLDGYLTSCTFDYINRDLEARISQLCLVVGGFLVPFLVILLFYFLTLKELNKRKREIKDTEAIKSLVEDSGTMSASKLKLERKQLKIVMIFLTIYCFTWIPYACMSVYAQFGLNIHYFITPYSILPPSLLTKAAFFYSPILFSLAYSDARKWCWSIF